MKITMLGALAALTAFTTLPAMNVPSAEAASITITTGESGHSRWRDDDWRDNGRHLGWHKQRNRNYGMRMRERREIRTCEVTTHRYWRNGRRIVEKTRDCY